jgi:hypothetical protein
VGKTPAQVSYDMIKMKRIEERIEKVLDNPPTLATRTDVPREGGRIQPEDREDAGALRYPQGRSWVRINI